MSGESFEALLAPQLRLVRSLVERRLSRSGQAEDVVQEILMRAFARRNQLREDAKFSSWLCSITMNEVRTFFRRDRGFVSLDQFPTFDMHDPSMSPLTRVERRETSEHVHACMAKLSKRDRTAIQLRDIEGKSLRDVAAALHGSESAAKAAHFRARRRLAEVVCNSAGF